MENNSEVTPRQRWREQFLENWVRIMMIEKERQAKLLPCHNTKRTGISDKALICAQCAVSSLEPSSPDNYHLLTRYPNAATALINARRDKQNTLGNVIFSQEGDRHLAWFFGVWSIFHATNLNALKRCCYLIHLHSVEHGLEPWFHLSGFTVKDTFEILIPVSIYCPNAHLYW